ncbi:hypothetical protein C7212DRAFT_361313 [Tuber magnatum]|uniref:Copper-fist domain-containing protein n=1 Tax=Tuber magnatum TaxID=42249 RepID=A0A317T2E6_9PEZI|nr:hypothetical protein C7212DRAFT_361313 [Tuber magnatum]
MMIDGVKMACEACIRGHRVSGCNHSDRKLLPIAKKGRPVSQCNHCRQMRKARSAHVKCDCGERLALLKESKAAGKPVPATASACHSSTAAATAAPPEEGDHKDPSLACLCCHGGRCTCALKKEHLDSVPELAAPVTSASIAPTATATATVETRKPRLQATHSEGSLTTLHTFANGHHRPTHGHRGGIHGSSPYTIPHVGHTGHTFGEHIGGCTKASAATVSAPPSAASQKPRRIKSEHSSPDLRSYPALKMANTGITPLELTPQLPQQQPMKSISNRVPPGLSVNTNTPYTVHEFRSQELLPSADSECSFQFSAGLYPPQSAGWPPSYNAYDSAPFDEQPLDTGVDYSVSQLDIGDYLGYQPSAGLNGSVSGDEIDDFIGPVNGPGGLGGARTVTRSSSSDTSDQAESDFRVSAASSFVGLQQASSALLPGNSFEDLENLNPAIGPMQPTDPSYGLVIGTVDGALDSETRGLSLYGGYSDGFLSLKEMATTKASELGGVPSSLPPADDGDYLWMAPPMSANSVQDGAPPPERWVS